MMQTAIDKLRELRALHEDGLLSRQEFDSRKNAILDAAYAPEAAASTEAAAAPAPSVPPSAPPPVPPPAPPPARAGTEIGLMAGQEVGPFERRYRLDRLIAHGGMGQVWQATDLATEAELGHSARVALKILAPQLTENGAHARLLIEEAARARQLAHEHIVRVYDWAQDPATSSYFIIMECLDGEDFDSLLAREGPLDLARTLDLLAPAADALDHAWQRHRLVHRDIKPANLFLTAGGEVKLLDFGIAASARGAGDGGDDSAGAVEAPANSGTAGYRAPEAGRQADAPGPALDVYAVAVLVYRMVSGRLPFAKFYDPLRDPLQQAARPAALNEAQWDALQAGFALDPAARPASVRDLLARLAAAAGPGAVQLAEEAREAQARLDAERRQAAQEAERKAQLAAREAAIRAAAVAAAKAAVERQRREQEKQARAAAEEARAARKETLRRQLAERRELEVEKARAAQEEAQRRQAQAKAAAVYLAEQKRARAEQLAREAGRGAAGEGAREDTGTSTGAGAVASGSAREGVPGQADAGQAGHALAGAAAEMSAGEMAPAAVPDSTGHAPAIEGILRDKFIEGEGKGPELVLLPTGRFQMGSPEHERQIAMAAGSQKGWLARELPQHWVGIERPLAMGRYPVLVEEWREFVRATGWRPGGDVDWNAPGFPQTGRHPVVGVNWFDALRYVRWLSEATGHTYRLPSEAEWEYACRAGTRSAFSCGDTISPEQANYDGNFTYNGGPRGAYRRGTTPAEMFAPNPWGLHDMHGNVWEWVQDVVHDNYEGAPLDGSAWEEGGDQARRILRGGSWLYNPRYQRSALRNGFSAVLSNDIVGFRVVRELT